MRWAIRIDLNSDMGESFGAWKMGADDEMFQIVSSANIACGFHAGDPVVMADAVRKAKANGVGIGAHPSFLDLWGFGRRSIKGERPEDIERIVAYQIGALLGVAAREGGKVVHVKMHGTLGTQSAADPELALAVSHAIKAVDPTLIFVVMAGTELERAGEKFGLQLAREIYADRSYDDNGQLVSRDAPGAVLHDSERAAARVLAMIQDNAIHSQNGKRIPVTINTVCVHGDTPDAVSMAKAVRARLKGAGIMIAPLLEIVG